MTAPAVEAAYSAPNTGQVLELPVAALEPAPWNPRKDFDEGALDELAASLLRHGMLQPIVARPVAPPAGMSHSYQILAGERRWRAAVRAGLRAVPVSVRHVDDRAAKEITLLENAQRRDLNPIEAAESLKLLLDDGMTQAELAAAIKVSQPTVAKLVGLLRLPEDVRDLLRTGQLSTSHGEVLSRVAVAPKLASHVARRAAEEHMSTRELERRVIPYSYDAEREGLLRRFYDARFDAGVCKTACPFGAYLEAAGDRYCLRPDHWDELQAAAKKEAARELNRAVQEAKRAGTAVRKLSQLPYDSYVALRGTPQAGCSDACPCRSQGIGYDDVLVPICTDPARHRKLVAADQKAAGRARAEALQARRDALQARLLGLEAVGPREMALVTAKILSGHLTIKSVRPAAARHAPDLDLSDPSLLQWSGRGRLWAALAAVPVDRQVRLVVDALLSVDLDTAVEMEHHKPELALWYLGEEAVTAPSAPDAAIAASEEFVGGDDDGVAMHDGAGAPEPEEVSITLRMDRQEFDALCSSLYCADKIMHQEYRLPKVKAGVVEGRLLTVVGFSHDEAEAWELVEEQDWGDRPKHELWLDERLIRERVRGRGDSTGSVVRWRGARYVAARRVIIGRADPAPIPASGAVTKGPT